MNFATNRGLIMKLKFKIYEERRNLLYECFDHKALKNINTMKDMVRIKINIIYSEHMVDALSKILIKLYNCGCNDSANYPNLDDRIKFINRELEKPKNINVVGSEILYPQLETINLYNDVLLSLIDKKGKKMGINIFAIGFPVLHKYLTNIVKCL